MIEKYYVAGCVDNGLGVDQVEDQDAEFWTLYARDGSGESEGIIDCVFREDAVAAMAVCVERDALNEQVRALAADNVALINSSVRTLQDGEAMKQRCNNPNSDYYHRYGGRGITISKEWSASFEAFLNDMGEKPEGMSIDRIDNNKGYSPDNCRWATNSEQGYNKEKKIGCTSRYVGVSFSKTKKKWKAQIKNMGKNRHIGYFNSEEMARDAYLKERSAIADGKIPGLSITQ